MSDQSNRIDVESEINEWLLCWGNDQDSTIAQAFRETVDVYADVSDPRELEAIVFERAAQIAKARRGCTHERCIELDDCKVCTMCEKVDPIA